MILKYIEKKVHVQWLSTFSTNHFAILTAVDNDYLKFLQINNIAIYNVW